MYSILKLQTLIANRNAVECQINYFRLNPAESVGAKRKFRFIGGPNSDKTTKITKNTKNDILGSTSKELRVLRGLK